MDNTKMFLRAALLLVFAVIAGNLAQAQTCTATWTGNACTVRSCSWFTAGNWSPSSVPGPASDVCIPTLTTADATTTRSISVHSIQVSEGGEIIFGAAKVSIATSLNNQGLISLYGTTLSAASIDMPSPGEINSYNNSSITSPAFSNTSGTLYVGPGGTLRLPDNPVQLQNGSLGGGNWYSAGTLIIPSDISQLTSQGTSITIDGFGSVVHDASGNNALATLTSVGPGTVLAVVYQASLTVAQDLTSQGIVDAGSGGAGSGSLTVSGSYTQESGASTNIGDTLSA